MYNNYKVYGPYKRREDGRLIVVLKEPGSSTKRTTVSYPKYLVECYLNRYLGPDETVDHIDGNFLNNELSNLRVVPRGLHAKSHTTQKILQYSTCPICGNTYTHYGNRKTCGSKQCVGKSTHVLGHNAGNTFTNNAPIYKEQRQILSGCDGIGRHSGLQG